ncbi:unnamed protein product [Nezara viridula]|uniref:Uncharacterized protein n=1 Tax=Nezara viridula TaxID=85310 RepID=A0A9P0HJ73_NEZVI|nr:unnamed protein product [Nezara viridula]
MPHNTTTSPLRRNGYQASSIDTSHHSKALQSIVPAPTGSVLDSPEQVALIDFLLLFTVYYSFHVHIAPTLPTGYVLEIRLTDRRAEVPGGSRPPPLAIGPIGCLPRAGLANLTTGDFNVPLGHKYLLRPSR